MEAFRQGLRELGYVEGKNILIEYRHSEGKPDRLAALAAELVRLKVDVIVTSGPTDPRRQENNLHDSHCVCAGRRSCRKRFSRQSGAAWRQRYWTDLPFSGATWKTTGVFKESFLISPAWPFWDDSRGHVHFLKGEEPEGVARRFDTFDLLNSKDIKIWPSEPQRRDGLTRFSCCRVLCSMLI